MKLTRLFKLFTSSEKSSGIILMICSACSIILANTVFGEKYVNFWHLELAGYPLEFWINDALMTIFFLMVGLEIEREFYAGELSSLKRSMLPVIAAFGGMLVPALIHAFFNFDTPTQKGFGIPMATDIAFSLAVLSLLGNRVPPGLRIFLTALAIIDDLGAIIIIAIFYTGQFSAPFFFAAMALFALLIVFNRLKVYITAIYIITGMVMWYCMLRSGIHPTITGVMLAFAIPFGKGDERSVSYRLQHRLHGPVAFFIIPLFALANTALVINSSYISTLTYPNSLGIVAGLFLGKPIGIFFFSLAAIGLGICALPPSVKKMHLLGAGSLAGIGFTMSMFITLLAFTDERAINASRIAIIGASLISAIAGFLILKFSLRRKKQVRLAEKKIL